ncbi:PilZ domain-containing protein [Aeoliella sp. ICT_H6.2]|uniref:PilZ domain-containing protein n=1 Tax=Aeoliella straminimaris TaxID=2954799 RepID=A0A9X2FAA0_9BACT|nr:PilZ domain-containing protein [Aeoliella straminimaris]MCO6044844.1 PilZ domain-containing protein [Aeoliella straminimaris]
MSSFLSNEEAISLLLKNANAPASSYSPMIGRCRNCSRELQWAAPSVKAWASAVPCPECSQYYFTEGRSTHPPTLLPEFMAGESEGNLSDWLTKLQLVRTEQPGAVLLVRQVVGSHRQVDERREHIRFEVDNGVVGIPLDEQGRPTEMAVDVTLMNLSISGMQLAAVGRWNAPLIAVDFAKLGLPGAQLIARVVWQATQHATSRLGCKFLMGPKAQLPLE